MNGGGQHRETVTRVTTRAQGALGEPPLAERECAALVRDGPACAGGSSSRTGDHSVSVSCVTRAPRLCTGTRPRGPVRGSASVARVWGAVGARGGGQLCSFKFWFSVMAAVIGTQGLF